MCNIIITSYNQFSKVIFFLAGPFRISNGDRNYWKVNKVDTKYILDTVDKLENASFFYIIPNEDGIVEYEFNIAWDKEDTYDKCLNSAASPFIKVNQMHKLLFLATDLNFLGHNSSKMRLKKDVHLGDSLTLRKRMQKSGNKTPASIGNWIKGIDVFYIHCSSRFIGKGYIAVSKRPDPTQRGKYINEFKCYSSVNAYNDSMLFQLHPFSPREIKIQREKIDKQFCDSLLTGSTPIAEDPSNDASRDEDRGEIESATMATDREIHEISEIPSLD